MKPHLVCLFAASLAASLAAAAPSALPGIQAEMRALQFDKAIELANQAIAAKDAEADHALFLKATAEFQRKKFAEVAITADRLIADFPQSKWQHKAAFLKAQALIEQKKFAEAAAIYQAESARILSPERKQALVGEILRFAEKLETKPDPNVPDAPQPDFAKAYSLYTKALAIELPRDFRDSIVFRKARAIQQAGNPAQAVQDFQAYLTEYDPAWTGPAGSGSARLPMVNPPPAGKHVAMARFRLAEAFHQSRNPVNARMELEDLLKIISAPNKEITTLVAELATDEGKKLPEEIRWLTVQTHFAQTPATVARNQNIGMQQANIAGNTGAFIGNTGGLPPTDVQLFILANGDLDQAILTCRNFIAAHPAGSRAVRAAWMIAEALQTAGRADDAITAYREFIATKGFRLPEGEAATAIEEELRAAPATHLANLQMRALFRIGQILASQKKYEEAIATWQNYVKDHPNGPEWSESQNAIINAEFQMGLDALTDKQEELAMRRFDTFLRAHPLDERAPRILYLFGAIHEAKALDLEDAKGAKEDVSNSYRKAIDEWAKLVSKYPESAEARAALLKSGSILEEKLGEFEKALKLYQKVVAERGDGQAQAAIARLTQKSLTLSADRVFRTNEKPVVHLKLRNIEQCEVRLYKIDLQAYFRKMHVITGVEGLDVSLIQPDKTWTLKPENYAKYQPLEQDVEIPFPANEAGAYVVTIGDDDWESTVLVLRSDLEVVVKASRREVLTFIQDMRTGKPAAGVELLVSNGKAVAATGKTGTDGVFKTSLEELKDLGDVRVFALHSGHAAAFNLPLAGLQLSSGLKSKGYLYTDRPAYLPGETVSMRGILRDVINDAYAIPESPDFTIRFSDPQGRLLSEQAVKLGKFGTFDATLVLPSQAKVGTYTMTASQSSNGRETLTFQGTFDVREFKLEKIKLTMDFPRRVWFRGEKIEATVQAAYYWGEPLANRVIRCTLPDRRIERITTDAEGKATLSFDTTALSPGSQLSFTASLDGENVAITESLTLARLGFSITAKPSQPVVIAGEPFNVDLSTTGADGKPTGESLKITVLRMEKTKTNRILTLLPWPQVNAPPSAEVKHSELESKTDATTGKASIALTLEKGGIYHLRITGTDRFGQPITFESGVEVSDNDDVNKLRLFAADATLRVGQDAKVRLHSRLDKGLALLTYEGESILRYQIVDLRKDYNDIGFAVGHDLFPNFRLAAAVIDGRDLRTAHKEFTVERELKVVVKPVKDHYFPGEEGKVEITVTDQTGKPVEAELSLALVNEALYAVVPDTLTPILDFFQKEARRHAEFHTGATCGFRYTGTTRPVAKAITDEKDRLVRAEAERRDLDAVRAQMEMSFTRSSAAPSPSGRIAPSADSDQLASDVELLELPEKEMMEAQRLNMVPMSMKPGNGKDHAAPRREVRGEGRWLPSIVTDADGKAVATITMPETTTAWRLTARGCSVETLVGQATATTLTRKDFFVALKTPSFLREGDDIRVVGRIHNLTDFAGTVPLTLKITDPKDPSKVLATREKSVEVKAKGGAEVTFDSFVVSNSLNLTFELSGNAGDQNDKLELSIPIQPWGIPFAAHAGGSTNQDTAATLTLPEGREYTSHWMTLSIGPDVKDSVLDMALQNYGPLVDYARIAPPMWGGHPAHDLLATATALAYAKQGKADDRHTRLLAERARSLVAILVSSQAENGSWNSNITSEATTARAFWALVEARNAGIAVHKGTIDLTADFLLKQLQGLDANDNDSKAIVLHALSTDKRADFAACNRIYRDRNSLGSATLAYLARAFFNLDRKEIAAELTGILETKATAAPGQPGQPDQFIWESGYKVTWLNDTPETTALVLLALAESKPESPRAAAAAESLLHFRSCFGYHTGRAHGTAVAALSAWFARGKEQSTDLEIAVHVNGTEIAIVKSIGSHGITMLEVPKNAIKAGKNLVEFKARGRGRFTYAADLFGFSADTTSNTNNVRPGVTHWQHMHAPLEYRGKPIGVASSSPVKNLENGQRVNVRLGDQRGYHHSIRWFVLDIPLPAGARLVPDSISHAQHEIVGDLIRIHFANACPSVSYDLTGYVPGKFRVLPTTIREIGNPAHLAIGPAQEITVLAVGEKSPDPYVMNRGERYTLGSLHFNDGDYAKALEYLTAVFKENPKHNESELARMLLWIHTMPEFYDARKIVEMFEILRERFPSLEIPFDKILVVGKAYQDIGENERAWLVYRAVISASFTNDAGISAVLEDEGRFLGSIDYQERVWREYPDTAEVTSAYFALSQLLYQKAPTAHDLPKEDEVKPEKIAMLKRTADLLGSFLALYPTDPLADDAAFSLCNAMLVLKNYPLVVRLSNEFAKTYAKSELVPSFQYMTALGLFWQNQYGEALAAARVVADGDSKDKNFARYILGQIYHAQGKPKDAITWYDTVKTDYPDAQEAIQYFEKKSIGMEEVSVFEPGYKASLTLKYRNIKEAFVQIYRVDLMKLYLQQKNLSAITSVQLAGIKPESEQTITLGDGKDYVEKDRAIPLALKDEAAYLVIVRGDDLFASSMVLITPLKIEVQEDPASGRIRANVLDTAKGGYRPEVHVKAIGSADSEFRSGETDLRGIFIADNLRGKATVIAREGNSKYAFFRGTDWLGTPDNAPNPPPPAPEQQGKGKVDYQGNLDEMNQKIQFKNNEIWNQQRRQAPNKGVQIQMAY
jgi:tetratricopeptide (TPR) repeat protein